MKRRGTLFGVDLAKIFGMGSVADLSGEGNHVLQQVSARQRAWKSKSNLWILAARGLQEFKGLVLMFVIRV